MRLHESDLSSQNFTEPGRAGTKGSAGISPVRSRIELCREAGGTWSPRPRRGWGEGDREHFLKYGGSIRFHCDRV
ncbi:hypothetical protein [Chroococcidiopsis thermalis]|uniref:hypothetical protein n=1 Tax=Chroococcidiopsis thermalis TaxID=54299 RepID=UPI0015F0E3F6|nr:hypothetical protein [Chroococcidiopsis thermalis]